MVDLPLGSWDGHCHTGYCPHGSGAPTRLFVKAARYQGLGRLSLTEHPLFPPGRIPEEWRREIYLERPQLERYLAEAHQLREAFSPFLEVRVGLEVDYIPTDPDFPRTYLEAYGQLLDDAILSLHFLPGKGGLVPLDITPQALAEGLVGPLGGIAPVRRLYWRTLEEALEAAQTWGEKAPRRVAHLDVVGKFEALFPPPPPEEELPWVEPVLRRMAHLGFSLELNASGLDLVHRRRPYPAPWMVELAQSLGVPLVYGSDAHRPEDVGRYASQAATWAKGGA